MTSDKSPIPQTKMRLTWYKKNLVNRNNSICETQECIRTYGTHKQYMEHSLRNSMKYMRNSGQQLTSMRNITGISNSMEAFVQKNWGGIPYTPHRGKPCKFLITINRVFLSGGMGGDPPPPQNPKKNFVILETNHVMIFSWGPMNRGDKGEHLKPLYRG